MSPMPQWTHVYIILTTTVCLKWLLGSARGSCVPQVTDSDCDPACDCERGRMICSSKQLPNVPERLMEKVSVLYLNDNNIKALTKEDFMGCRHVRTLDLAQNAIATISKFTFKDTLGLKHLSLQNNLISYSTLHYNTFAGLSNLQMLDISNNAWKESSNYGNGTFRPLTSLTKLTLDVLPGRRFPKEIINSRKLSRIRFHNGLTTITNETFADFANSNVRNVSISSAHLLETVEPMSFAYFKNLSVLDISYNNRLGLMNASAAWYGLQYTRITKLVLTSVSPDTLSITVPDEFFRYLNLTNITVLLMSRNRIVSIADEKVSTMLPKLTNLDLSVNQIQNIQSVVSGLSKLNQLTHLDLSGQLTPTPRYRYDHGSEDWADYSNYFGEHEISRRRSCTSFKWSNCSESFRLRLGRKYRLPSRPFCLTISPHLKELKLRDAIRVEKYILPQVVIRGGKYLKSIDLGSNGLRQVRGPIVFSEPVADLKVDLSDNQIDCISPLAFNAFEQEGSQISGINLSKNRLDDLLQSDVEGETFRYLEELQSLDLSENGIKYLPINVFAYNWNLSVLDLSNNALKVIEFNFSHMHNLSKLVLSNNLISTLSSEVMQELSIMFRRSDVDLHDLKINLNGNPLQCSCDNRGFLHWIASNRHHMEDVETYTCMSMKPYLNFSDIDEILVSLDYKCRKWIAVIVSGFFSGVALVVLAAVVVCYRNRWEIRYACLKLTQRSQRYQQLIAQQIQFRYDAFVVYNASDRQWVNDELMPHLEPQCILNDSQSTAGMLENSEEDSAWQTFKLCVHERDFPPGEEIITNIWQKMELSRKVILVISKNFTESRYCEYELNLARMRSVELSRNVIVPILLEMPDVDSVSDGLRWILRKVTYIEWPRSGYDRRDFWENLKRVLSVNE